MFTQKLIKVGNSRAVTIPKPFLEKSGYKTGDELIVEYDGKRGIMILKTKRAARSVSLSPEFFMWLDKIGKKYEEAISELAKK